MKITEVIKISLRAIRANKLRTFLTMLGIIIGVAAVILLVSIGSGLKNYIVEQFESLGADNLMVLPGEINVGSSEGGMQGAGAAVPKFTFEQLEAIKKQSQTIKGAMAYTENNSTLKYRGKTEIAQASGVGPDYQQIRNHAVERGAFFSQSHYNSAKRVAVLGQSVVDELFGSIDPVGKTLTISGQNYLVLGTMEEMGAMGAVDVDNQVFIPATTAIKQFDMDYITSFIVQSKSADTAVQTKKELEIILGKFLDEDEFSVLDTKDILNTITQVLSTLTLALGGIAAISLLVGGIGIMNIMLVSVTERTKEIGLRKAVGAQSGDILLQFIVEAVFLSVVGGLIGIGLGIGGSLALNQFINTSVTPWSVAIAFGVSGLVGVVFGVAPAAKAARLDPIDALRFE